MIKAEPLTKNILTILEEMKALDLISIDVKKKTSITDYIVIATGTSNRHTRATAQKVVDEIRDIGVKPFGIEGMTMAEWILLDLGDVVVHIMRQETRDFYNLEQLWLTDVVS